MIHEVKNTENYKSLLIEICISQFEWWIAFIEKDNTGNFLEQFIERQSWKSTEKIFRYISELHNDIKKTGEMSVRADDVREWLEEGNSDPGY